MCFNCDLLIYSLHKNTPVPCLFVFFLKTVNIIVSINFFLVYLDIWCIVTDSYIYCVDLKLTKMSTPEKNKDMEEAVKKVNENPKYKVLTKEEYEILMGGAVPKTSTPRLPLDPKTPKVLFGPTIPGATPTRMQQIMGKLANQSGKAANLSLSQSFANVPSYNSPKLPFFSGSKEPAKGETSYEVWQYEVKCLQKSDLPEHMLLHSIRTSLRGAARDMLIPLGEDASVNDVIGKLDDFYGNVSSAETILQSFYSDNQKEDESVATFGSRLEQTLSKAIRYGHMELAARDSMLRSKFWTGLRSQQLRNSTRYLYDTYKDFPSLLREIRKVEQEDFCSTRPTPPTKQKVVQQHSGQVSSEQSEFNDKITKQMSELMGIVKSFEKKLESQQQSIAAAAEHQSSYQDYNYGDNGNQRGKGRGYKKPWRGNGRGYRGRGNSDYQSGNSDYQQNNRGGFRGGRSRGRGHGGANGRGANRGGGSNQSDNSLN